MLNLPKSKHAMAKLDEISTASAAWIWIAIQTQNHNTSLLQAEATCLFIGSVFLSLFLSVSLCLVLKISRLLFPSWVFSLSWFKATGGQHSSQNFKRTCAASMELRTLLFQSSSHGKAESVVLQTFSIKGAMRPIKAHDKRKNRRANFRHECIDAVRFGKIWLLAWNLSPNDSRRPDVQVLFHWAEGGQHPTMSTQLGKPSPKTRPRSSTCNLQSCNAHCNTALNKRRLRTHPCRTPAASRNLRVLPNLLVLCPVGHKDVTRSAWATPTVLVSTEYQSLICCRQQTLFRTSARQKRCYFSGPKWRLYK